MELSIGAYNGAHQIVSGPAEKVAMISERLLAENIRVSRLHTDRAFHSALVEPVLDNLESLVAGMTTEPPLLTLVSNVTGQVLEPGELLDAGYWRRHTREPVAFGPAIETLAGMGVDLVVEVGPHAVLGPMATLAWPDSADGTGPPLALSILLRPSSKVSQAEVDRAFTEAVAKAYEAGLPVSFAGLFAGETRRRVSLPGYPFQRRCYWVEAPRRRRVSAGHPLLGVRHDSPRGEILFETEMFASDPLWLKDHRVFGRLVAPGVLYGGMATSAALADRDGSVVVEDLQLHSPLVIPDDESERAGRKIQVVLDGSKGALSHRVEIFSRGEAEEGWTLHAEGRVSSGASMQEAASRLDLESLKAGLSPADVSAYYRAKTSTGIDFGPAFRTLEALWTGAGEALGEVVLPEAVDRGGMEVHPILLDGCFQVLSAARDLAGVEGETTYMPFGWERLWLTGPLPERMVCHAQMRESGRGGEVRVVEPPEVLAGDVRFYTPNGVALGGLIGFTVKRATRVALLSAVEGLQGLLYEVVWRDRALTTGMLSADFLPAPRDVGRRGGAGGDGRRLGRGGRGGRSATALIAGRSEGFCGKAGRKASARLERTRALAQVRRCARGGAARSSGSACAAVQRRWTECRRSVPKRTGSATAAVLPELPAGRFDYVFTDVLAGFFAQAEARFGDTDAPIEYRALDIEADPVAQGFDDHGYDLVIAANVLHATRDLGETLSHCRKLLAPSGQLVALEILCGRGWQDLTFGLLDGWWRFADVYRPDHALAGPPVWRRALGDAGFGEAEVLGAGEPVDEGPLGPGVIVARSPAKVTGPRGVWILAADHGGRATELAGELAARNQTVVLAAGSAAGVSGRIRGCRGIRRARAAAVLAVALGGTTR